MWCLITIVGDVLHGIPEAVMESLTHHEHEGFHKDHDPENELRETGVADDEVFKAEACEQEEEREDWQEETVFFVTYQAEEDDVEGRDVDEVWSVSLAEVFVSANYHEGVEDLENVLG